MSFLTLKNLGAENPEDPAILNAAARFEQDLENGTATDVPVNRFMKIMGTPEYDSLNALDVFVGETFTDEIPDYIFAALESEGNTMTVGDLKMRILEEHYRRHNEAQFPIEVPDIEEILSTDQIEEIRNLNFHAYPLEMLHSREFIPTRIKNPLRRNGVEWDTDIRLLEDIPDEVLRSYRDFGETALKKVRAVNFLIPNKLPRIPESDNLITLRSLGIPFTENRQITLSEAIEIFKQTGIRSVRRYVELLEPNLLSEGQLTNEQIDKLRELEQNLSLRIIDLHSGEILPTLAVSSLRRGMIPDTTDIRILEDIPDEVLLQIRHIGEKSLGVIREINAHLNPLNDPNDESDSLIHLSSTGKILSSELGRYNLTQLISLYSETGIRTVQQLLDSDLKSTLENEIRVLQDSDRSSSYEVRTRIRELEDILAIYTGVKEIVTSWMEY